MITSQSFVRIREAAATGRGFYNHIFACDKCYAPVGRYCDAGRELWIEYSAPIIADSIVNGRDLHERRRLMNAVPEYMRDRVEQMVREKWDYLRSIR